MFSKPRILVVSLSRFLLLDRSMGNFSSVAIVNMDIFPTKELRKNNL